MRRIQLSLLVGAAFTLAGTAAAAGGSRPITNATLRQDAKSFGATVKKDAKVVGVAVKHTAVEIGHAAKDFGLKVADATKKGAHEVDAKTKD